MKKIIFLGFVVFGSTSISEAQFEKNSWETGLLFNAGSSSISNSDPEAPEDSFAFFSINILPAYYIFEGLSIEPQFVFTATKDLKPELNFIGNLSYTIKIKKTGFAPYIKLGYGVSNSFHINFGNSYNYNSDKLDIGIFNSSAGLKFLVSKKVALRGEINYKIYNTTIDYISVTYNNDRDVTISNLSFLGGLSFLF